MLKRLEESSKKLSESENRINGYMCNIVENAGASAVGKSNVKKFLKNNENFMEDAIKKN